MKLASSVRQRQTETLTPDDVVAKVFARIDRLALGMAVGLVAGGLLFAATAILLLKGGEPVGPNLSLLKEYIPGYSVSWTGNLIGGAGGFVAGFAAGWTSAFLNNLVVATYIYALGKPETGARCMQSFNTLLLAH